MQEEQDLPIDIHANKLLDWLISRRHCNREWSNKALVIREKINNAIQDMPVHEEITKLLSGTYINYFHCLKIVEILKETESESKNIFGRYSSQRMKDWQEVVSLYEKENLYLAEAAQLLIRNVKYEIPALKRQITKLQQIQQESEKKAVEFGKHAKEMKDKYNTTCRQMGIKGVDIRAEFKELIKDMPSAYDNVVGSVQKLTSAVEYYTNFAEYVTGKPLKSCLPILNQLREKGNTTIYEWKYGKKPTSVEEPKLSFVESDKQDSTNDDAIDFGEENIDFGEEKIDFGDEKIDFGDQIDFGGAEMNLSKAEEGVARNEEALTILDSCSTRNDFVNDLCELESFLEQRLQEMQVEGDLLSMNQFQSAPAAIQMQTVGKVSEMLTFIRSVLNILNDVKMKQLLTVKESPRYVDRLIDNLNQNLRRADKMMEHQEATTKKGRQALEEEMSLNPKIALIIERTKELQKLIELEISKKYKNRPVNIMGSVNILQQASE